MTSTITGFEPREQILFGDDFDHGLQGWTLLTGNYEGSLDTVLPEQRDFRPPMLSNLTMWDTGTAGSLHGSYAMKLATRAARDSISVALKRLTFGVAQPVRVEAWFTSKPFVVIKFRGRKTGPDVFSQPLKRGYEVKRNPNNDGQN